MHAYIHIVFGIENNKKGNIKEGSEERGMEVEGGRHNEVED